MEELTILVLEDHPFQRQMLVQQLRQLTDCRVLEAADGHEALALMQQQPQMIDLVFCDLMMEGMSGVEFIRLLGQCQRARSIVILSALEPAITFAVAEIARTYGLTLLGNLPKPLSRHDMECLLARFQAEVADARARPGPTSFPSQRELQQALDEQHFELHYQPKVEAGTLRCCGVEALVRWNSSQWGPMSPAQFVPLMERLGLERRLSSYTVHRAIRQAGHWRRRGRALTVAVNVSLLTLEDTGFIGEVEALLQRYELPPNLLTIEVTETAFSPQKASILESLVRLRMLGVGLSIDDFGTGYSSLLQLSQIPFTELKIDHAFVKFIDSNERYLAIVRSTVQLAGALGMTTVAEGVERRKQAERLSEIGCQRLQGYLFARPMPLAQLEAWLDTSSGGIASAGPGGSA